MTKPNQIFKNTNAIAVHFAIQAGVELGGFEDGDSAEEVFTFSRGERGEGLGEAFEEVRRPV